MLVCVVCLVSVVLYGVVVGVGAGVAGCFVVVGGFDVVVCGVVVVVVAVVVMVWCWRLWVCYCLCCISRLCC